MLPFTECKSHHRFEVWLFTLTACVLLPKPALAFNPSSSGAHPDTGAFSVSSPALNTLGRRIQSIAMRAKPAAAFKKVKVFYPDSMWTSLKKDLSKCIPVKDIELTPKPSGYCDEEGMRTLSISPGPLGITIDSTGRVNVVKEGQLKEHDVQVGDVLTQIDNLPYSPELLQEKARGASHYLVEIKTKQAKHMRLLKAIANKGAKRDVSTAEIEEHQDILEGVRSSLAALMSAEGVEMVSVPALGQQLQADGVFLPDGMSLSQFLRAHSDKLLYVESAKGRGRVGLVAGEEEAYDASISDDAQAAKDGDVAKLEVQNSIVERLREMLLLHGPMTRTEMKMRLNDENRNVPSLNAVLSSHDDIFEMSSGTVRLVGESAGKDHSDEAIDSEEASAGGFVRLRTLNLPGIEGEKLAKQMAEINEVIFIDLDNRYFPLELAVHRTAMRNDILVLAVCNSVCDPRLPERMAASMGSLAEKGRLKILTPVQDCANAADFVLAFWAGWLHAHAPRDAQFFVASHDESLVSTVEGLLGAQARTVKINPSFLDPAIAGKR